VNKEIVHTLPTRYGMLRTLDPEVDLISRFLARYGEWGQDELRFVAHNLPDNAACADCGAFLGTFGIGLAQLRPLSRICFVDANSAILPLLRANVQANLTIPAHVVGAVVGPAGEYQQGWVVAENAGALSLAPDSTEQRQVAEVAPQSMLLSELDAIHGPFNFIKLDVEGMEATILEADRAYLQRTQATLWLECNESPHSLALVDLLRGAGYSVFYCALPAISLRNFNKESDREYPFAFEAGLWATKGTPPTLQSDLVAEGGVLKQVHGQEDLRQALWLTPRWAPKDWEHHPFPEVIALATNAMRGRSYDRFLTDDADEAEGQEAVLNRLQVQLAEANVKLSLYRKAKERGVRLAEPDQREMRAMDIVKAELDSERELRQAAQAEVERLAAHVAELEPQLRAHEITLHGERERHRRVVQHLRDTIQLSEQQSKDAMHRAEQGRAALMRTIDEIYRSRCWRWTMPLRMLGRIARGDWAEVKRIVRARLRGPR
jgi:FkbM family methyltransferase